MSQFRGPKPSKLTLWLFLILNGRIRVVGISKIIINIFSGWGSLSFSFFQQWFLYILFSWFWRKISRSGNSGAAGAKERGVIPFFLLNRLKVPCLLLHYMSCPNGSSHPALWPWCICIIEVRVETIIFSILSCKIPFFCPPWELSLGSEDKGKTTRTRESQNSD